jgi:hypothetical protein
MKSESKADPRIVLHLDAEIHETAVAVGEIHDLALWALLQCAAAKALALPEHEAEIVAAARQLVVQRKVENAVKAREAVTAPPERTIYRVKVDPVAEVAILAICNEWRMTPAAFIGGVVSNAVLSQYGGEIDGIVLARAMQFQLHGGQFPPAKGGQQKEAA